MKKVAILYPAHYEQSNGGAELQISYFATAAVNAGHKVYFIYVEKNKPIKNDLGLELHPIKNIKDINICGKGWFRYRSAINKQLDIIKPDVIYTRLGSSWIDIAARYAKKNNIKHIHALASDIDVRRYTFSKLFPIFSIAENYLINRGLKNVSLAIAQNEYQEETFKSRFKKNCIRVAQMTPLVDESLIQKNDNLITILWVGNLKRLKRPEIFVDLASKLEKHSGHIKMEMYGRYSSLYSGLIEDTRKIPWLEYKGEVTTNEMLEKMQHSHILINTSEYEGFSNTYVQAWMRKIPVISMGSNPNHVFDNFNVGRYVQKKEDLVDVVSNLLENRQELSKMAEESYKYAVHYHSLENNMCKIIELL